MTAIYLAVVLVVGFHYESRHPLHRLHLVRQTGYNLYFRVGSRGFIMAMYALVPSLLLIYMSALVNGIAEKPLYTDKTYSSYFQTALLCYDMLFAALIMKVLLTSIERRFDGVIAAGYGPSEEHIPSAEKQALFTTLMRVATEAERLIIEAAKDIIPMRIILSNGKVYIGWPQTPELENGEITQIKLLPILSGYLTDQQQMVISRNYYRHYQDCYDPDTGELIESEDSGHDHISRFCIIIPVADIKLYSLFSIAAFEAIENDN